MRDRFAKVDIINSLQYLQECDLYNKNLKMFTLNIFNMYLIFYVRRMGNYARVKDNNRLGTQKAVSFDFDEKLAREGRQGNLKKSRLVRASKF